MADTYDTMISTPSERRVPAQHAQKPPQLWNRVALGAVLVLSIFMNFFQLGQGNYGNLYYAASVRSMTDSLHNFFFVAFDPGGFVSIDKPILGFWLQTISAKIFGFTPFSIFFPQALCGVLSVLLLYYLVRRHFGVIAGLVAALALAVSPISVVTNRNNTIDSTLALALLLSAWAVIHAAETGKLRWLLLSAVFVGLGFNIKMAEAYLVLPALFMTYLLCAPRKVRTRIWHLALFTLVFFALSISWLLVVDLTPASQRPYVDSTQTNSEISLAFGYNGLNRLHIGGGNPGFGGNRGGARTGRTGAANGNTPNGTQQLPAGIPVAFESGAPGLFRLFSVSLGGQIAWLLPFALLGIVALAWQKRLNMQKDRQQLGLVLWGFWLVTMVVFFTLDGAFHQYYMTEMAPGLSAFVGIGLVMMWKDYRSAGWRGWLLPIALVITAGAQIYMLTSYPAWATWMSPLIGVLTALTAIALIVLRVRPQIHWNASIARIATIVISIGMFALLIAPTVWSGYSVIRDTESSAPAAGPTAQGNGGGFQGGNGQRGGNALAGLAGAFGFGESAQADPALISYLEAHQGTTKFLVAVSNSNQAAPIILATNKPVMAMGGFSGGDPILTASALQTLIHNGTVRYFLLGSPQATSSLIDRLPEQYRELFSRGGGRGGFGQQSALPTWVGQHCKAIPASAWSSTAQATGNNQLYDCAAANA